MVVHAYISPFSNRCKPFICDPYTTDYSVNWGCGRAGRLLYNSDAVDLSKEGLRFVQRSRQIPWSGRPIAQSDCYASAGGLCDMVTGLAFPSSTPVVGGSVTSNTSSLTGLITSDQACSQASEGSGLVYSTNSSQYDIATCNIQSGQYTLLYTHHDDKVGGYYRTFGPMAYTLILLLCTVNLTGIVTVQHEYRSAWILYIATAICSITTCMYYQFNGSTYSITIGDYAYTMFTMLSGTLYCLAALVVWTLPVINDTYTEEDTTFHILIQQGACLHAIDALGMLIYHTPETPYSGLLLITLAARTWSHLTRSLEGVCRWWNIVDVGICAVHFALLAEFGVLPQLIVADTWVSILGTVIFGGYVWVHCDCGSLLAINAR